jgi:Na+-translocating ferredoxin:NAD+ oxidoreductase RnfG subunit
MNIRLIFLFAAMFCFTWALSQDPNPLSKKEQKFASRIFEGEPLAERLNIPDRVYLMKKQDTVLGYLLSTSAKGRYDYFDYTVAYATDFSVMGLSILVYRSSHGAAICQKGWLRQFEGYAGEEMTLGKEIDAVAGATLSATSLVKDMKRVHQRMILLKEEGIIE